MIGGAAHRVDLQVTPDSARRPLPRPWPQLPAPCGASARCCSPSSTPTRAVDTMLAKFAEWESELAAAAPTDNSPRIGEIARRFPANLSQPCHRHRCVQSLLSRIPVRPPRCRESRRPGRLPAGRTKGRRGWCTAVSWASSSTASYSTTAVSPAFRQNAFTGRDIPPPDTATDRTAFRHRADPQVERASRRPARLLLDDEVLCTGEVNTLASPPEKLAGSRFGRRRKESDT